VIDVSAIFVARIHFRAPRGAGAKMRCIAGPWSAANMGTTMTSGCPKGSWRAKRSTAFSRLSMSSCPGRKIRTSPGGWST
jgi:hypothetical protein